MKEYAKMLKNMFQFQGRARRREYWVVNFLNGAIGCFLYAVLFFACTMAGDGLCYRDGLRSEVGFSTTGSTVGTIMVIPIVIASFYFVVCMLGLTVRRYHDAGIPGWAFPICLLGCCLCGIGAIVHLVFCLLPSKEDNMYGKNPKAPENNEYQQNTGIIVSILVYIICLVLMIASVIFNITKCGLTTLGDAVIEENVDIASEEDRDIITEENIDIVSDEEEDITTEENETTDTNGSYEITIGTAVLNLTPPADASDVYSGDSMLSYDYDNIYVEYGDSFCELTGDALGTLKDKYEIQTSGIDEVNHSASVEPMETKVGDCNAYYFKVVNTYTEDLDYIYYTFFVDIGAENYLEVVVYGMSDDFTEEDAFEIADLNL